MKRAAFGILILVLMTLTACGKDKMTAEGENEKGLAYYNSGDYETARAYFERALKIEPGNKEVLNNYGMVLIQLREYDLALEQFNAVIVADASGAKAMKRNKFAYRGQGIAYMQKLEFEKALESFINALAISTESGWNIDIMYYKANAQECLGKTDEAVSTYTQVLEMDPKNVKALCSRANLYREKGDFQNALEDYETALARSEGSYQSYLGLYTCYRDQGEDEKAEKTLDKASRLKINNNEDKYLLGQVHFYQKNYTSAKIEMQNAVENGFTERLHGGILFPRRNSAL